MLGAVDSLRLELEVFNLTSIPAQHIASLVSSVTVSVDIREVRCCDLVTILDNVRCEHLYIYKRSLETEETEALVRAMEARVKEVELGDVTLEMKTLTKYSGHGKCNKVMSDGEHYIGGEYGILLAEYREELRSWATSKGWEVTSVDIYLAYFEIKRN